MMKVVLCSVHKENPLEYFCLQCENKALCSECVIRQPDHQSHIDQVQLIPKAYPVVKSRIEQLQSELGSRIQKMRQTEQEIEHHRGEVNGIVHNAKSQMQSAFRELRQRIDKREAELLQMVDQASSKQLQTIDSDYRVHHDKRKKIEEMGNLLSGYIAQHDEVQTLDAYTNVKNAIKDVLKSQAITSNHDFQLDSATTQNFGSTIGSLSSQISEMPGLIPSSASAQQQESYKKFAGTIYGGASKH